MTCVELEGMHRLLDSRYREIGYGRCLRLSYCNFLQLLSAYILAWPIRASALAFEAAEGGEDAADMSESGPC